jgi:hypothetical protein
LNSYATDSRDEYGKELGRWLSNVSMLYGSFCPLKFGSQQVDLLGFVGLSDWLITTPETTVHYCPIIVALYALAVTLIFLPPSAILGSIGPDTSTVAAFFALLIVAVEPFPAGPGEDAAAMFEAFPPCSRVEVSVGPRKGSFAVVISRLPVSTIGAPIRP